MKIQVIISRREFIPDTAAKTGISEEELVRRFEEAETKGKQCVFTVDLPAEHFRD